MCFTCTQNERCTCIVWQTESLFSKFHQMESFERAALRVHVFRLFYFLHHLMSDFSVCLISFRCRFLTFYQHFVVIEYVCCCIQHTASVTLSSFDFAKNFNIRFIDLLICAKMLACHDEIRFNQTIKTLSLSYSLHRKIIYGVNEFTQVLSISK